MAEGKTDFTFKLGGPAGYGIAQAGALFSKACTRSGYFVFVNNEYPSLIRGGHNTVQVRIRNAPALGLAERVDLVLALDRNGILEHISELVPSSVIVYDSDEVKEEDARTAGCTLVPMPLISLARQVGGEKIMKNTVGLGAIAAISGLDIETLNALIRENFSGKREEVAATNIRAARLGYDYVAEKFGDVVGKFQWKLSELPAAPARILVSGNEAVALGAMRAGCRFLAAYPMTPASAIMHYYAANERTAGVVMKHVEDEISGINMAIGANFAGARAMVATSGGGFSLQTEGLGLAAMTETPVVIVEVQRPGPATGLPTHTGQGDLHFVINAHQDEFPRVVVAPGDTEEAFRFTFDAFNWAEKFQAPVIVLSDKYLAESQFTHEPFEHKSLRIERGFIVDAAWLEKNKPYKRYERTENGVAPRALPGTPGGIHRAPSDERDEFGNIDESPQVRKMQVERRLAKFRAIQKEIPLPIVHGSSEELTFVGWGSSKGAILEAIELLAKKGIRANFVQFTYLWPFPPGAKGILEKLKRPILVEGNSTAQLGKLIRQETGLLIGERILKYDGRPISADFVVKGFEKLKNGSRGIGRGPEPNDAETSDGGEA
ncbi:MAG: 2-oxoacid:acceptor oxidoreductase subunit alpha [archaeon]